MPGIREKYTDEFKKMVAEQGIKFKSEAGARELAENFVRLYAALIVKVVQQEQVRKARLKNEPKGFLMQGGGYTCALCHSSHDQPMQYNQNGMKCLACQEALDKEITLGRNRKVTA